MNSIHLHYLFIVLALVAFSWFIHKFARYYMGSILGNEMAMTSGHYCFCFPLSLLLQNLFRDNFSSKFKLITVVSIIIFSSMIILSDQYFHIRIL